MAQFETIDEITKWTGKSSRSGRYVARQKVYKHPDGRVIGLGPKEMYEKERRDYKRHPRTGAEQQQAGRWQAACQLAMEIRNNPEHPRYAALHDAWLAQLDSNKPIRQFENYLRSILSKEQS